MADNKRSDTINDDQIRYWNSSSGKRWLDHQQALDDCFADISRRLIEFAEIEPGMRSMDIGCGTGAASLDLAKDVGAGGHVLAVDVSDALLAFAIERAKLANTTNIEFLLADAQTCLFPSSSFDLLVSRFGVMFFDDPVAAFVNLARSMRPGGRLVFVAWAAVDKNPWFEIPRDAAINRLGRSEPLPARAPGPLAFAEIDYVREILANANIKNINIQQEVIPLTKRGTPEDAANLACNLGPATRIIKQKGGSAEDYLQIKNEVAKAFEVYFSASEIRVPATVNFVSGER